MIVYKIIDEFSRETGKKTGSRKVYDFEICDFTGEKMLDGREPSSYDINFKSNDPCFGDGEGERWLYKWKKKVDADQLFGTNNYIFLTDYDGMEIIEAMLRKALEEIEEIWGLDQILRWSRGKMLEKVLKDGTYKIEQFLPE